MQRSPGDQARRDRLVDAASGVEPAGVVLYLNVHGLDHEEKSARQIAAHDHAAARDWVVAEWLIDNVDPATHRNDRPGWQVAAQIIEDEGSDVRGIVVPSLDDVADTAEEQAAARKWAVSHGGFLTAATMAGQGGAS
ncbi:hypothetical protein [Streptomyces alboflavus]|uniref:hypothetical protein n=1 Tax=Streptomyces alboflavus TaxID=67267 RepID=UPI0036AB00A9